MSEQDKTTDEATTAAHEAVFGDPEATAPDAVSDDDPTPSREEQTPPEAEVSTDDETAGPQDDEASERDVTPPGAGGGDGEPSASPDTSGEPPADLEGLWQYVKTTEGRLAAAEAKNKRLADEMEALRAGRNAATPNKADQEPPEPVELPESLRADAAEFDQLYPDLAPLLRQPGKQGDRLRRVLEESGADIAGILADNIALRSMMSQGFQATETKLQTAETQTMQRAEREHLERIAAEHPEVRGYVTGDPGELAKTDAFVQDVLAWVETLPFKEADAKLRILQPNGGSSAQVSALLAEYKKAQAVPPNATLDAATKRRAELAGGVDNRRGAKPRREKTPQEGKVAAFKDVFG